MRFSDGEKPAEICRESDGDTGRELSQEDAQHLALSTPHPPSKSSLLAHPPSLLYLTLLRHA